MYWLCSFLTCYISGRRLTEGQTKEQLNPLLEEETGKFVEELYIRHQQVLDTSFPKRMV